MEIDDQRLAELAIVENLQRKDLNAIEKAVAFKGYLDSYGGTQEELAGRLGIDRSTVSNLIRLLDLPPELQQAVCSDEISPGHARALLAIDDAEAQLNAFRRVVEERLSVRQTEVLVRHGEPSAAKARVRQDPASVERAPHVVEVEQSLRERFAAAVSIRLKAKGRGQIVIDFQGQEELDRLAGLLAGQWAAEGEGQGDSSHPVDGGY
jgi:ParB family chromosome partitioning protein